MRVLIGLACFAGIPPLVWLTLRLIRNPEFSFWKHPLIVQGPFARFGLAVWIGALVVMLVLAGITVLFDA